MSRPLQLLLVEDSADDAALVERELKRASYDLVCERVQSAETLQLAMMRQRWDLVLCDFTLPKFKGTDALNLVRQSDLNVPFIFVSGTMGEDVAVEAMKSGAQDYVMKGNLARLAPAVRRELRDAANRAALRSAEDALRESELRHRRLWECCPDAVLLMDSAARIYFANPAAERLFGLASTEILDRNFFGLLPGNVPPGQINAMHTYFQLGSDVGTWHGQEITGTGPGDSERVLEISFSDMDLHGDRRIIGFVRDVTHRKLAERELHRNREQFAIAREIQQGLFPKSAPSLTAFDIAGISRPADATGGDYFDYLPMANGRWGIIVGDVTGHGLGPALLAAETRAYFRILTRHRDDLRDIFMLANSILAGDIGSERFVTVILLRLEPKTRKLVYANAGHPPAYLLGADGEIKMQLKRTCIALGLFPEASFGAGAEVQLDPGDLLLLLTDGVAETLSPDNRFFGMKRAVNFVRENRREPAKIIVEGLCHELHSFRGNVQQGDDITIVVVKVL